MGQVAVEEHLVSDVFGTHVNLASRILSLAKAGQVLVSGSVWDNASGWLKEELVHEKVNSVYYGRIKLKGIAKATEVYEFYTVDSKKKGIPETLRKRRTIQRIFYVAFIVFAMFSLFALFYSLLYKQQPQEPETKSRNWKIFMAAVSGSDEDFYKRIHRQTENEYEAIPSKILESINNQYFALIKNEFISEYTIETESDLLRHYARGGKSLPDYDSLMIELQKSGDTHTPILSIKPYLLKFKEQEKYYLNADITIYHKWKKSDFRIHKVNMIRSDVLSVIDSVAYTIKDYLTEELRNFKRSQFSSGVIKDIRHEDVLIKFDAVVSNEVPIVGLIYAVIREYEPFTNIEDEGVKRRLNDLGKVIDHFGTVDEWNRRMDTSNYLWTYKEYTDLNNPKKHFDGTTGFSCHLGIELTITEVFDSTALAKISNILYPWTLIPEKHDKVVLKY